VSKAFSVKEHGHDMAKSLADRRARRQLAQKLKDAERSTSVPSVEHQREHEHEQEQAQPQQAKAGIGADFSEAQAYKPPVGRQIRARP
jgi:type II secretory pathway component PulK